MSQQPNLTITQQQKDKLTREKIKRLWNKSPEVHLDAVENLKSAWGYHAPSFRIDELATMPHQNCSIMAAKRDAYKEIIDWLTNL